MTISDFAHKYGVTMFTGKISNGNAFGAPNVFKADEIRHELSEKFDAIQARQIYSNYKRAPPGSSRRELARLAYLVHKGIPGNCRSENEQRNY
jgi:hypothetical protein